MSDTGKIILEDHVHVINDIFAFRLAEFEDEFVIFKMLKGSWRRLWVIYINRGDNVDLLRTSAVDKYKGIIKNAKAQERLSGKARKN